VVDWFKPVVTQVEAVVDGSVVANSQVIRRFAAPGVRSEFFNRGNIAGILYRPRVPSKGAQVILLGGSEGGFPTPEGPLLASRGFTVLALAYFGAENLPVSMRNIPIEYFGRAISEMRALPGNEGAAILIVGGSRGGEAALIIGSTYPDVGGVVAMSASHVRWEGATAKLFPGGPAWTYGGKPLPYVPFHISPTFAIRYLWASATGRPISLRPMFIDSLGHTAGDDVEIPVERIRGPVLLGSGGDDRKWPSALMSRRVIDRLRRNRHPY
jgi:pimeloyl-ACP methyl ester carboxylesterase